MIKESLDLLKKGGPNSNILVTSSICGTSPMKESGIYGMTKAALNNMVKWLSMELSDLNIRVNSIGPNTTKSNMTLWL